MFYGKFSHTLDDKNRLRVPSSWRTTSLVGGCCVGKSRENQCLVIYPKEYIADIGYAMREAKKAGKLNALEERAFKQYLTSFYDIPEDEPQGRFTLNAELREFAGIQKNVVFVGSNEKIELWAQDKYEEFANDEDLSQVDLSRFGL